MRKSFGARPLAFPQTVFVIGTYDGEGAPNAMNAAWCCQADTDVLCLFLSKGHKTTKNILLNKDFTVGMATVATKTQADYVGLVSGNEVPDKVKKSGLTPVKADKVNAPFFQELPIVMECRLISYDPNLEMMLAKILDVTVDDRYLGADGKPDLNAIRPIVLDAFHDVYVAVDKPVGKAYHDGLSLRK